MVGLGGQVWSYFPSLIVFDLLPPLVRGSSCRLCIRALVTLLPSHLGGLASVGWLSFLPGLLHLLLLTSSHGFLGGAGYLTTPVSTCPLLGGCSLCPLTRSCCLVMFYLIGCPTGRSCIYMLSLDRWPASFGASLLPARPSPFCVGGLCEDKHYVLSDRPTLCPG